MCELFEIPSFNWNGVFMAVPFLIVVLMRLFTGEKEKNPVAKGPRLASQQPTLYLPPQNTPSVCFFILYTSLS